jgi:hypothetical protein
MRLGLLLQKLSFYPGRKQDLEVKEKAKFNPGLFHVRASATKICIFYEAGNSLISLSSVFIFLVVLGSESRAFCRLEKHFSIDLYLSCLSLLFILSSKLYFNG